MLKLPLLPFVLHELEPTNVVPFVRLLSSGRARPGAWGPFPSFPSSPQFWNEHGVVLNF